MHYVSWDRTDRDAPKLLAEQGPQVLADFTHERAMLHGPDSTDERVWDLVVTDVAGAVATENGREIVRANGSLKRAKNLTVAVAGRPYHLIAETSKNWIIDDAAGNKVGQFTSDHSGVRRAILEFEGETHLPYDDIVGLAWVSRLILESRKALNATALIGLMVFLSIFIVIVWLVGP